MERTNELFLQLVTNTQSADQYDLRIQEIHSILFERIQTESWFRTTDEKWLKQMAESAVRRVISKLEQLKKWGVSRKNLEKEITIYSSNLTAEIFFVPEVVNLIYSPHESELDAFVNEGVNYHCSFIRRAVASVIRKYGGGIKEMNMNQTDLEDELWGSVMEEVVRCMTDMSARVWFKGRLEPQIFPKEGIRGSRKGIIQKVALSQNGNRLAAYRSDHSLSIWDVQSGELVRMWDLSLLTINGKTMSVGYIYFSQKSDQIAVETDTGLVATFHISDDQQPVRYYEEKSRKRFFKEFGTPFIPDLDGVDTNTVMMQKRSHETLPLANYAPEIYDWTCDESGEVLATASERRRSLPEWMIKAGFERAVFHIAKKRWIDLLRKHSHTGLACWRCGAISSGMTDTRCRECGVDFTKCPIGCPIPPSEPLNSANHWTCPHCGLSSRTWASPKELSEEEMVTDHPVQQRGWVEQHDLNRILGVLKNISIAYKNKQFTCGRLVALKADGRTNEEIGMELDIPKGSVDYVWNQCRTQISRNFEEF